MSQELATRPPAKRFVLTSEFWMTVAGTGAAAMVAAGSLHDAADAFGPTWGPIATIVSNFLLAAMPIAYAFVRAMEKSAASAAVDRPGVDDDGRIEKPVVLGHNQKP